MNGAESRKANLSGRVRTWFLGLVPVHVMVANRIILGGVLFLHPLSRIFEFGLVYGSGSVAWSAGYREFAGRALGPDLGYPLSPWVAGLAGLDPELRGAILIGLYGVLLASALAFTLGLFTRPAGSLTIVLHMFFVTVNPLSHYSWARLLAPFALYVVLSRAGDYASLDAWRRRRGLVFPPGRAGRCDISLLVPAWPMRLLQLHVAAMYFHSGFSRIDDPGWLHGEVLFEALSSQLFSRFTLDLQGFRPLLTLLAYAVFLLEPLAAVALWIPRLRTLCALALLAMHVSLEILTNVGWWNYLMIGGLLAFLPPAWLVRCLPHVSSPAKR